MNSKMDLLDRRISARWNDMLNASVLKSDGCQVLWQGIPAGLHVCWLMWMQLSFQQLCKIDSLWLCL